MTHMAGLSILLEHRHAHSFTHFLWWFSHYESSVIATEAFLVMSHLYCIENNLTIEKFQNTYNY